MENRIEYARLSYCTEQKLNTKLENTISIGGNEWKTLSIGNYRIKMKEMKEGTLME